MSTRKILTLASMIALSFAPAAFGADIADMATQFLRLGKHFQSIEYSSINGEKQDSGLGDLPADYSAAEFQRNPGTVQVLGEKLDSGLGDLSPSYTAAEFQRHVVGEKQDSGLGDLASSYSAAEFQRPVVSAMGEKLDSGLGDLPADYTAAEFQKQVVAKR